MVSDGDLMVIDGDLMVINSDLMVIDGDLMVIDGDLMVINSDSWWFIVINSDHGTIDWFFREELQENPMIFMDKSMVSG